jgi:Uncharacterized alpha/beta hydrolase domain (DUF2235)
MKRLQLFLDGTAVSAAQGRWMDRSNIFRTILALHYEGDQVVFYMPGVGTRGDGLSTVTAKGLDEIVREAYVHLAVNHLRKDEIYIFGYSRGGAAALALSAMISDLGLLWADHLDHLHGIWRLFIDRGRLKADERRQLINDHVKGKVREGSDTPVINFLGVFDPVAGNQWDRFDFYSKIKLGPIRLGSIVRAGVSILSIDDNRNPSYSPMLWEGPSEKRQSIEQIWMPGVHGDVGGNSAGIFLSDIAFLTMIERARACCPGLVWDDVYIEELEEELLEHAMIEVSKERFDWKRKLLLRADRRIGKEGADANELLHPIFDFLHGNQVKVRGRFQRYAPAHVPQTLKRYSSTQNGLFKRACDNVLQKTPPG